MYRKVSRSHVLTRAAGGGELPGSDDGPRVSRASSQARLRPARARPPDSTRAAPPGDRVGPPKDRHVQPRHNVSPDAVRRSSAVPRASAARPQAPRQLRARRSHSAAGARLRVVGPLGGQQLEDRGRQRAADLAVTLGQQHAPRSRGASVWPPGRSRRRLGSTGAPPRRRRTSARRALSSPMVARGPPAWSSLSISDRFRLVRPPVLPPCDLPRGRDCRALPAGSLPVGGGTPRGSPTRGRPLRRVRRRDSRGSRAPTSSF